MPGVRLFCVCVVVRVGRGLATGRSPVRGALPTMYRIKNLKSGQGSTKGCRAIERLCCYVGDEVKTDCQVNSNRKTRIQSAFNFSVNAIFLLSFSNI
jgi:hypothetical protein